MPRVNIPYENTPRQKTYDPTTGKKGGITVPDCSHTHGFDSFTWPPTADPRDLPCEEDEGEA
jgi:hypothetical protein